MHLHWWRWNCTENVVENMRADILEKKNVTIIQGTN